METSYRADIRTGRKEVAQGLFLAVPGTATHTGVELEDALFDIQMTLDLLDEGIRATSVTVTAQDGTPVTGTTLRAVRVWDLARLAIAVGMDRGSRTEQPDGSTVTSIVDSQLSDVDVARLRSQGPTEETLGWVAYFYGLANVLGVPPARQVEIDLGLPRTTASKWVRRAREKGLIGGEHPKEA